MPVLNLPRRINPVLSQPRKIVRGAIRPAGNAYSRGLDLFLTQQNGRLVDATNRYKVDHFGGSGPKKGVMSFDGSSGYAHVIGFPDLQQTFSLIIKVQSPTTTAGNGGDNRVVSKGTHFSIVWEHPAGADWYGEALINKGGWNNCDLGTLSAGVVYTIGVTYDDSNGILKTYKDGNMVETVTGITGSWGGSVSNLVLSRHETSANFLDSEIEMLSVWRNVVIGDGAMRQLYFDPYLPVASANNNVFLTSTAAPAATSQPPQRARQHYMKLLRL